MTACNIPNRTIFCDDNLDIMRGINSECIDLIYLDPPFNKNKKFTAPIGSSAEGAEFSDIFRQEDVKDEWLVAIKEDHPELYHYLNGIKGVGNSYNFAYLAYMAIRLLECHRILKLTASIYLHCDPTMSHYLKSLMDCVFGEKNFRNEIVWCYEIGGRSKQRFAAKHDAIMYYAMPDSIFNADSVRLPRRKTHMKTETDKYGNEWQVKKDAKSGKFYRYPVSAGALCPDWWTDIQQLNRSDPQRTGYPAQKPMALLERIIKASSNESDIVLDPFCGCATTCVAAERLGRRWIGIDVSFKAYDLVRERLNKEAADPEDLFKHQNEIYKTDPPKRTDLAVDYREKKYVYVISHPSYPDEYKVGIAKNWRARLNAYQTSDPDRQYKIEFKLETPLFRETEKHIHEVFPNKHEWVQGDLKEIVKEIKDFAA